MKIKIKKVIVGVVLATAMIVPTVASAADGYITSGIYGKYNYTSSGWADYQHNTITITFSKAGQTTARATGWQSVETDNLYGLDSNSYVTVY